jgi:hypothetical protein
MTNVRIVVTELAAARPPRSSGELSAEHTLGRCDVSTPFRNWTP